MAPILEFFAYEHLPEKLREVSCLFKLPTSVR
jgi:hypothetical protein